MHPNYQFLVSRMGQDPRGASVLDFGSGPGAFVSEACAAGMDCYGADVFYDGIGREEAAERGLLGDRVREITGGVLPFADGRFDYVVSNFVFEHVEDLAGALAEMRRVLRPGGRLIALYTTRSAIREGHVNMPLVHRMRPGGLRFSYVLALRRLGFGRERSSPLRPRQWTEEKLGYIDRLTFYRSHADIAALLHGAGFAPAFIEDDFLAFRLGRRIPLARPLARWMGATALEAARA